MELTIETLIKIVIGIFVIVLVVSGLYFFGSNISDFFKSLPGGNVSETLLPIL